MWRYLFLVPAYLLSTALPLAYTATANLEYEYALVASYLALLFIPLVALLLPARYLPAVEGEYQLKLPMEVFWIFIVSPVIGLLSGVYMFATGICPCSQTGFAFWMSLLWYPAWILAHAIFHGILRARVRGFPRALNFAALALIYAFLTVVVAVTLWTDPQKRTLSLLLGFLHGPIYDDWIAVDGGILLARIGHLALATSLLFAVWWKRQRPVLSMTIGTFATLWIVMGVLANNYQSTQNGKDDLDRLLSVKLEGDGFTLHYRPLGQVTKSTKTPIGVQRLFRDAQFYMNDLKAIINEDKPPHVELYVYPSDDLKKLWFGAGSTDVTDVYTPSVHISLGTWPHPTLRHELAHALTSGFAFHGLGFHPNMAFTEGLAVALAPEPRSLTLDDGTAALITAHRLPAIETLFTPMFWKVSGSRAYTAAGSFIRYLIAKHGIKGVKALYGGADWKDAFGKTRDELVDAWRETIMANYDAEKNAMFAEAVFRQPGVLEDLCPHSKADLSRSRDDMFVRMRQPIGWDPEVNYLTWLAELDPKDESARLKVWRREIRNVAQDRFAAPGRLMTWREALERGRNTPAKTLEDVEMALTESDVARVSGDVEGSLKILTELSEIGKKRYLGEGLTREIETRLKLEQTQAAGAQTIEWRRYLAGFRKNIPDAPLFGSPWLLTYLKLRNARDLSVDDLRRLLTDVQPEVGLPSTFYVEWYRILADRLMRQNDFPSAALAYAQAAKVARPAARELYLEHVKRAKYYTDLGPIAAVDDSGSATR